VRLFQGRKSIVGCDLGHGAVKLVQLAKKARGWKVVHAELHDLSPEAASQTGWPSAQAIQVAMRSPCLAGQSVAVSLQSRPPAVRYLDVPPMPLRDLREALKWEAKKTTSLSLEEVIVDYVAGAPVSGASERKIPVTMVVAERAAVEDEYRQYQRAGLPVKLMDINPLAFYHAAHRVGSDQTGSGCVALVDIGAARMEINVVKQGALRFTRSVPLGGDTLTHSVMQKLGADFGQAETIKREQGLAGNAKIQEVLRPEIDRLVVEIQRSVDYYRAQSRDGALERMFLAGGAPLMPGFVEHVASFFDAKVALFNPFEGMDCSAVKIDLESLAPRFVSSVGLALRGRV